MDTIVCIIIILIILIVITGLNIFLLYLPARRIEDKVNSIEAEVKKTTNKIDNLVDDITAEIPPLISDIENGVKTLVTLVERVFCFFLQGECTGGVPNISMANGNGVTTPVPVGMDN